MRQPPTTAVLLAAGRGKRLRPHTDHTPKPMLPFDGRPTLDYVLTATAAAGIQTACLVTHHLGNQIERFVGDGSAWGLTAVTCHQPALDGTARALQTAVATYPELFEGERPFVLTATDYVLPPAFLADLVAAYLASNADILISLKQMPRHEVAGRSSVAFLEGSRIARIIEKPTLAAVRVPYVASLVFVLPVAIADYLPQMTPSSRGEFEIQTIINQMLQEGFTADSLVQDPPREWRTSTQGTDNL